VRRTPLIRSAAVNSMVLIGKVGMLVAQGVSGIIA
jgi:hypothetical protein